MQQSYSSHDPVVCVQKKSCDEGQICVSWLLVHRTLVQIGVLGNSTVDSVGVGNWKIGKQDLIC